ncbi:MAG TPA: uroporphyrinogen-III synthase [Fontimonas sp.]
MSSASAKSLEGLTVAVTRPAAQAASLCLLLEQHGAQVVRLPLQSIEPVRPSVQLERELAAARDASVWIFTSVNAVRHARALTGARWPLTIAVGPATAAALSALGAPMVVVPVQHSSEGILALPELQDVRGRSVVLVSGEGGRDRIENGLRDRGALLQRLAVYRRVNLPYLPDQLQAMLAPVQAIVVTNGEALQQLVERMPAVGLPALRGCQLVVPSQRVVEQASHFGFTVAPLVLDQMLDTACLHCLQQWWSGRGRIPPA